MEMQTENKSEHGDGKKVVKNWAQKRDWGELNVELQCSDPQMLY